MYRAIKDHKTHLYTAKKKKLPHSPSLSRSLPTLAYVRTSGKLKCSLHLKYDTCQIMPPFQQKSICLHNFTITKYIYLRSPFLLLFSHSALYNAMLSPLNDKPFPRIFTRLPSSSTALDQKKKINKIKQLQMRNKHFEL